MIDASGAEISPSVRRKPLISREINESDGWLYYLGGEWQPAQSVCAVRVSGRRCRVMDGAP